MDEFHGVLVVDKPRGLTSRAVVDRAQRWFPKRTRLGHGGTLDPLATGVLVLGVGQGTRLLEYVQRMEKEYQARIRLGATSTTDDADGAVVVDPAAVLPDEEGVRRALEGFVGEIEQVPPDYSAAHVGGRRAYDLARRGREVTLTPRPVRIHAIELVRYETPYLDLVVRCGKGTYIRSLARDLGRELGCGGLIEELRRTRIGPFRADDGLSPEADQETARMRLLPLALALRDLPQAMVSGAAGEAFARGTAVPLPEGNEGAGECAVFLEDGSLVGVGRQDPAGGKLNPEKVIRQGRG